MHMTKPRDYRFNIIMAPHQRKRVQELADRLECSQAAVMLRALHALYTMTITGQPLCASGQRCYVPHMHPPALRPEDLPGQTTIKETNAP